MTEPLEGITRLKEELDALRPLPPDVLARIEQKLRLETNYNSNAIEGNSLALGETRSLILHGLTAHDKPMRDHLDIEGHDSAVQAIEAAVKGDCELNEAFIRNLHQVLLKEPYETETMTPEGTPAKRAILLGEYKSVPNNVRTSTGEIYYFTPPEQVKSAMSDLIDWYRAKEREGEHPVIIAATFHYRFVRIHPFDDGNGRMARLLMNMILIKHCYTVSLIRKENRDDYLNHLERADRTEDLTGFISYIANSCEYALNLHLKAARGESIEEVDDIDKEIELFKRSLGHNADQIPLAREYIDSTLYPFFDYCKNKAGLFSDIFDGVATEVVFSVTTMDDEIIGLAMGLSSLPSSLDYSTIPEQLRSISFEITNWFTAFQGNRSANLIALIKNTTDARQSQWTFSISELDIRLMYEGRDLEDLKKHFNELLRRMMRELEQRND